MEKKEYIIRQQEIVEKKVELHPSELMTIAEAARTLGLHPNTISTHLDTGELTAYEDPEAPARQGRRLILRSEFEAWKRKRKAGEA